METTIKLIEALSKLLGVVAWPAVVLFILIRFNNPLRDLLSGIGEVSLKGAGFEASAKRKQAEATAALAAAESTRDVELAIPGDASRDVRSAASFVSQVATPRVLRRISGKSILWVDDNPSNNIYPRQAFEAVGIGVTTALSTDEAIEKLGRQRFDVIISDMGRPPDDRAGYTLVDYLRRNGDLTPFVIYAGSRSPEHQSESRRHGAIGCTNRPDELFELVLSAFA